MLKFRKEALVKNQSPEHFDDLLKVTRPSHWYVTGAVILILISVVIWSFTGELNLKINGDGIILNATGISEVRTNFTGVMRDLEIEVGQHVTEGQILATVSQPQIELEIKSLDEKLERLKSEHAVMLEYSDVKRRGKYILELQNVLDTCRVSDKENVFFGDGVENVGVLKSHLQALLNFSESRLIQLYSEKTEVSMKLAEKQDEFRIKSLIRSPYNGIVVELAISPGDVFSISTIVCTIENDLAEKSELSGLVYVDASDAKRLDSGMRVLLSPASTSPEANGYIEGYIYYVSKYPATSNGMNRVLRNDNVVERLSENGLPLAVEVRFFADSTNSSGYRWTSGEGPDFPLVSGTFASVIFLVGAQRPVDVFVPYLSSHVK